MNKEIYLVRGKDHETYKDFSTRILNTVLELEKEFKPQAIKYTITEKLPPGISIIPFSKKKMAAISFYTESHGPLEVFGKTGEFFGAYRVTEALPVAYQKYWRDGDATPGACLLTLFSKKKDIDYPTFIDRWHNHHTPLSLRFHPLWNYVRNVVNEKLDDSSAPFDGIVEEQVKESSDLLNPFKFFGHPLIIIPRMLRVYADTKSFIDYPTMETYLAVEYWIKSK